MSAHRDVALLHFGGVHVMENGMVLGLCIEAGCKSGLENNRLDFYIRLLGTFDQYLRVQSIGECPILVRASFVLLKHRDDKKGESVLVAPSGEG